MDAYEKLFVKMEAERKLVKEVETKRELSGKSKAKKKRSRRIRNKKILTNSTEKNIGHSVKIKDTVKPLEKPENGKKKFSKLQTEKKILVAMKALKLPNDTDIKIITTDSIIKDCKLGKYILIVDNILEENNAKEGILTTISNKGIKYIIATGFANGFFEVAAANGLHLIKCSDAKLIDEGNNIEVYLEEGVIFDVDTGQEYIFNPALG